LSWVYLNILDVHLGKYLWNGIGRLKVVASVSCECYLRPKHGCFKFNVTPMSLAFRKAKFFADEKLKIFAENILMS
jgi:hypothetical protein